MRSWDNRIIKLGINIYWMRSVAAFICIFYAAYFVMHWALVKLGLHDPGYDIKELIGIYFGNLYLTWLGVAYQSKIDCIRMWYAAIDRKIEAEAKEAECH